jgi:N-acetylhexosamine 1-kinase
VIDPLAIAAHFEIVGTPVASQAHGAGHINQTWFIDTSAQRRYVLQRINPHVFADPPAVARNTARVIACIAAHTANLVPPFIAACDGAASLQQHGQTYRMLGCVAGRSVAQLESDRQAAAAGEAFGAFQRALTGYDVRTHHVPIEGFHSLERQLTRFDALLAGPASPRFANAAPEIEIALRCRGAVAEAPRGPFGMIHGDGKVTNLIFAADRDAVAAVVDLDTVMWGARCWDFGDLVRSAAALGAEDDPAIDFSIERFRALCAGYVRGAGELVDADLRAALVLAPAHMTFMLALRFLLDYLDGDRYFRIARPDHNLERARSQLRLFAAMQQARLQLERIVKEV